MAARSSFIGSVGDIDVVTGRKGSSMDEGFDKILDNVGFRGKYQFKILYLQMVPISFFFCGYNICQVMFQLIVPHHWCHVPGRENTSLSLEEWKNLTIPKEGPEGKYSSCSRYIVNWTHNDNSTYAVSHETEECLDGWDYDRSQFWETVATSYDWVCDKEGYSTNLLTINLAGQVVGTFFFPLIADRFGRRPTTFIIIANHIMFTLATTWTPSYALQMVFRFFRGLGEYSIYYIPFSTVLEVTHPDDRPRVTTITWMAWMSGMCFTALLTWAIAHWQYIALSSLPVGVLAFLYWNHYPESPRWLLSKNRLSDCADLLMEISKTNGKKGIRREELMDKLQVLAEQREEKVSFFRAFKYPKLRLRSFAIEIMNFCLYVVFGITFFGIDIFPENMFLSHFLLSLSELPSNFIGWGLNHYLGRRMAFYITISATCIFAIASAFIYTNKWALLAFSLILKFLSVAALFGMYIIVGEVYPTPIRSTAYGISNVFGMLGLCVSPSVITTSIGPTLRYWVMFGCSVLSLVVSFALPETIGLPLPQTFLEAENIGSGRPVTKFVHHWNYHLVGTSEKEIPKPVQN